MIFLNKRKQKPSWLKQKLPQGADYQKVKKLLADSNLNTVCEEAKCPNIFECFSKKTSTFMILGNQCTRRCRFCNIEQGTPLLPDPEEPAKIVKAITVLGLKYIVITSVTRDDLSDGGASQFVKVIKAIKNEFKRNIKIEVLVPDFQGSLSALKKVLLAGPDVLNHNIETVPSLYSTARPQADYSQSLKLIKNTKKIAPLITLKSGLMVGLGEKLTELYTTMKDIHSNGCDILTIGQYLQPSEKHLPVVKYYSPDEFKELERKALQIGFNNVAASPFVRSSYKAKQLFMQ